MSGSNNRGRKGDAEAAKMSTLTSKCITQKKQLEKSPNEAARELTHRESTITLSHGGVRCAACVP